ncbi:putative Spc97/Spc98 protein [Pseudoloma neurophilia]|uniref:Putative Spc97/Spc98 protein n=1 Tax=Pseudoloma neurophilia TaxID=146866 RepID=A0A0R0M4L6_9MICR|nr:putative Spc97/Spc98 protein [Pseudoloma neurophilia]
MFNFSESVFFKKITGQTIKSAENDDIVEKRVLNDIYFFLCGLNTESLRYEEGTDTFLSLGYHNSNILKEIQKVNLQIRTFEKFIYDNEYSDDNLRRIFSTELENKVNEFYNFIVEIKEKIASIEEFLVAISFYMDLFDEIDRILQIFTDIKGDMIINVIKERMDKMVQFETFYQQIIARFSIDINQRIVEFTSKGAVSNTFFMIRERTSFEFKEKFFRDKFQINTQFIPFYIDDCRPILESGLYSVIIQELVNSGHLSNNLNESDEISDDLLKFENIKQLIAVIKDQRNKKYEIINKIYQEHLQKDFELIKKYMFLLDQTLLSDIFADLRENIYRSHPKNIAKINRAVECPNIQFFISKSTLMNTMSKILNIEEDLNLDENLGVIDGLSVKYCPDGLMKMLFSEKNIHEFELIFRMLFTIQIINYSILRKNRTQFNGILLILNNNLLSAFYSNKIMKESLTVPTNDLNSFMNGVNKLIKTSLRDLYLTSYSVFKILSKYFVLCFRYIKYDKEDLKTLNKIIAELSEEIDNENHNVFLSNLLFSIKSSIQ